MKIRDYILVIIIVIAIIMFFQWRISNLKEELSAAQKTEFSNAFKQLSDGLSAKAETKVVLPPNEWQKFFNTKANKEFKEFVNEILGPTLREEVKKIQIKPGGTTIVNKSSILIDGDSAFFRNEDGIVTKVAKVIPVNGDSSMLVIVPQEIEITSVDVKPDPNRQDSLLFFISAFNKTTGDSLKVGNSISYVIPQKYKKWNVNFYPFLGSGYNITNKEWVVKGGFTPILYRGKKVDAEILSVEFEYGLKNTSSIELELINIQLKKRRY